MTVKSLPVPSLVFFLLATLVQQLSAQLVILPDKPTATLDLGSQQSNEAKEYVSGPETPEITDQKPAYCYIKKLSIKRTSDRRLEITAEMQGDIPKKEDRRFWLMMNVDFDGDANTGTVTAGRPDFGMDLQFWIRRAQDEYGYEGSSDTVYVGGKAEQVEIKRIEVKGSTITFGAQSVLFAKFPNFKFYACTFLRSYEDKNKSAPASTITICLLPRTGFAQF